MIVSFARYFSVLPEVCLLFEKVEEDVLKGGQLVDFLYECSLTGDGFVKEFYSECLEKCYGIMYNQVMLWVLHGRLFDLFDEFFIYRFQQLDKLEQGPEKTTGDESPWEEWDGVFSLRLSMLPRHVVTPKTAEKILFIGKCVRVLLRFEEYREGLFGPEILQVIRDAARYDFLKF